MLSLESLPSLPASLDLRKATKEERVNTDWVTGCLADDRPELGRPGRPEPTLAL